ncbi:hypothetical protein MMAGJ_29250 [Mycolicibacterium mageritense]|uniref:Secreted protein n=1 Tax=Mycolicibacterium mageritense TaxID=53462 RepID=A0ABM7HSV6_MYCME|nr:hypothetical protein MMAGJ_29250 [Mycolicibacterium mageritense]
MLRLLRKWCPLLRGGYLWACVIRVRYTDNRSSGDAVDTSVAALSVLNLGADAFLDPLPCEVHVAPCAVV